MVRLTRIYTKGGDTGETSLGDGSRVPKEALRVEAYGTVDEANAAIGLARLHITDDDEADGMLARIQNDLFDLGADLCTPEDGRRAAGALRIVAAQTKRLEREIDAMNRALKPLELVHPAGRPARRGISPSRAHRDAAGRAPGLRAGRCRDGQPRGGQISQPPLRPSVRAGPPGQRQRQMGRAVAARRDPVSPGPAGGKFPAGMENFARTAPNSAITRWIGSVLRGDDAAVAGNFCRHCREILRTSREIFRTRREILRAHSILSAVADIAIEINGIR